MSLFARVGDMTNAIMFHGDRDPEDCQYETATCCLLCAAELDTSVEVEHRIGELLFCSWDCMNAHVAEELWRSDLYLYRAGFYVNRSVHYAVGVSSALAPWDHDALLCAALSACRGGVMLDRQMEREAA